MRSLHKIVPTLGVMLLAPLASPSTAQEPAGRIVAGVVYQHTRFDSGLEPWHEWTAELRRSDPAMPAIARVNEARRFEQAGRQLELEVYPRLTASTYGLASAAYSSSPIFPRWRLAAELFGAVGDRYEISGGMRYLDFETDRVRIFTGTIGAYLPGWYVSLRPSMAPREGELLYAADLLVRRYLGEATQVDLRVGGGETPMEDATTLDLQRIRSLRAALDGRAPLSDVWSLRWMAGVEREKLPDGGERNRIRAGVGMEVGF